MVTALAETLDKKDPYTGGHVRRVVSYSLLLGAEMGLEPERAQGSLARRHAARHRQDRRAGPHPRQALPARPGGGRSHEAAHDRRRRRSSPTSATPACWSGCATTMSAWTAVAIRTAWAGTELPRVARIIAVADTYDAMTTSRPYRAGLPPERAAAEIAGSAGSQLCPRGGGGLPRALRGRPPQPGAGRGSGALDLGPRGGPGFDLGFSGCCGCATSSTARTTSFP